MISHASVRSRTRMLVGASVVALWGVLTAAPAQANVLYEFNQDQDGWTSTSTPSWTWSQFSTNEGSWKSLCDNTAFVSYLYSPCLQVDDPSHPSPDSIDVDFQHRFRFQDNPATAPLWGAGQVQFMLNNSGTWQGVTTWSNDGTELWPTLSPPPSELVPPLLSPGGIFAGTSPKYANTGAGGVFDKSSFQISGLSLGDMVQFRFVSVTTGTSCPTPIDPRGVNPLWDLDTFQVKGVVPCVPEPSSIALAAAGALLAGINLGRRRLRSRRAASLSSG